MSRGSKRGWLDKMHVANRSWSAWQRGRSKMHARTVVERDEGANSRMKCCDCLFGDPTAYVGDKAFVLIMESGVLRFVTIQCIIVSKSLLSIKKMFEVGQCVGFCNHGSDTLKFVRCHLERLKEKSGNYMFNICTVLYENLII